MENDSSTPQVINPNPAPTVIQPTPPTATPKGVPLQLLEYTMLGFGLLTVFSLIVRNGFMLTIGIILFLMVAVVSIVRSLSQSQVKSTNIQSNLGDNKQQKPTNIWKTLLKGAGIVILALIMIPVIGYTLLVVLFFIFIAMSGGRGT